MTVKLRRYLVSATIRVTVPVRAESPESARRMIKVRPAERLVAGAQGGAEIGISQVTCPQAVEGGETMTLAVPVSESLATAFALACVSVQVSPQQGLQEALKAWISSLEDFLPGTAEGA
jgi:hypothetical protein